MKKNLNISLTIILIEDKVLGGYTAFFKQFPKIIAEGDDADKATENLINAVNDVFMYQSNMVDNEFKEVPNVIQKPLNFSTNEC